MENDLIFPEAGAILQEAQSRHQSVWPFALVAVELAYRAFDRQRDWSAPLVPGVPGLSRVRNDINDDSWRFFSSVAEPLVERGLICGFDAIDGGKIAIMPDGLHVRLKKGDRNGATSNYPTPKISRMKHEANRYALYPDATELDKYIEDGLRIDVVFSVGASMAEYTHIGLRFANAETSPLLILDHPTDNQLRGISPEAFDLVSDARQRLA
jgi:hypothetical protein